MGATFVKIGTEYFYFCPHWITNTDFFKTNTFLSGLLAYRQADSKTS